MGARTGIAAAICVVLPFALGEWSHRRAAASSDAPRELVWSHGNQKESAVEATLQLTPERIGISVHLAGSHAYLAEYDRLLVVRSVEKEDLVFPMFADTGGTVRINVYRPNSQTLLLVDRVSLYRVDLVGWRVEEVERGRAPEGSDFVGAFDRADGNWQFIGAERRKEHPIENQSAG